MSRAAILCFTDGGQRLAERLAAALDAGVYRPGKGELMPLAARLFREADALVFIGACGIAVRAIAPMVASKVSDPAVVALDERGRHVVALLSGHIGGANALARRIAGLTGGEAVVTTATDVNGRFAVDAWAAEHDCAIDSMAAARAYAAAILTRDLPLVSDFPIRGGLPNGVFLASAGALGAAMTVRADARPFDTTLRLIPRILHVGVGCRRGASEATIAAAVRHALNANGLDAAAVRAVASIDVKRDEAGLVDFCAANGLPIRFYAARELRALPGEFSASAYVLKTVGVDNVCERAAMRSAGEGAKLIVKKTALDGVTAAVAMREWSVSFE